MKIHLVYEEEYLEQLKDILEKVGYEVVEWDYSLSQFADFSEKKEMVADVAIIDGQAGVFNRREIIDLLTRVRRNLPGFRLIVILPSIMKKDEIFISKLLTLSIYDMHFVDEYDIDTLESWLNNPKSYADYDLETKDIQGDVGEKPKLKSIEEDDEAKRKTININLGGLIKDVVEQKLIGAGYVVVGAVSPGAGSTTLSLAMANVLAGYDKLVTCVELSRRPVFYCLDEWPKNIEIVSQNDFFSIWYQPKDLNQLVEQNSGDYIVADLGCVLEPDINNQNKNYCQPVEHPLLYHLQLAIHMRGLAVLVMSPNVLKLGDFSLLTGHQQIKKLLPEIHLALTGECDADLLSRLKKTFASVHEIPAITDPFYLSQESKKAIEGVLGPLLPGTTSKKKNINISSIVKNFRRRILC